MEADRATTYPLNIPGKRMGAPAAYAAGALWVFGGLEATNPDVLFDGIVRIDPWLGTAVNITTRLPSPRYGMAVAVQGDMVYLFGGLDSAGVLDDVLAFNAATRTLTSLSPLPEPLAFAAGAWAGGRALLFGGQRQSPNPDSDVVYAWDPATEQAAALPVTIPMRLVGAAAVAQGDRVYLYGGRTDSGATDYIHRFEPSTGVTATLSQRLPQPVEGAMAAKVGDTHYVLGGESGGSVKSIIASHAPTTGAVATARASLPFLRSYAGVASFDGKAWLVGGKCGCTTYSNARILTYGPAHPEVWVDFRLYNPPPLAGAPTQFIDNSSIPHGSITGRVWEFGDGATSKLLNPSHLYTRQGTYRVNLTITDGEGATHRVEKDVLVENHPPFALFSWEPSTPDTSQPVKFTSKARDLDGTIAQYYWTFGDGATSTEAHPEHKFDDVASYRVRLTVTDNQGKTGFREVVLVIGAERPRAAFDFEPSNPVVGQYVQFRDRTVSPTEAVRSRMWDFGDGQSGDDAEPQVYYRTPGLYTVSLTVTNARGLSSTTTRVVSVAPADVNFAYAPLLPKVGEEVRFRDESPRPDEVTGRGWNFGDESVGEGREPTHRYLQSGTYNVQLTLARRDGSVRTLIRPIEVVPAAPKAAFQLHPAEPTTADTVRFQDASTGGGIRSWEWDFGDGTFSQLPAPTHQFPDAGRYRVRLVVTNQQGQQSVFDQMVDVGEARTIPPTAAFEWAPDLAEGSRVRFTDLSNDTDGGLTSWTWDFGDGNALRATLPISREEQNPSHRYAAPGTYSVWLTVSDNMGATTPTMVNVTVAGKRPLPQFQVSPAAPRPGQEVTFVHSSRDEDGLVRSVRWDFGDAASSAETRPIHAYSRAGSYKVMLTVTDDDGFTASAAQVLVVSSGETVEPTMDDGENASPGVEAALLMTLAALAAIRRRRRL